VYFVFYYLVVEDYFYWVTAFFVFLCQVCDLFFLKPCLFLESGYLRFVIFYRFIVKHPLNYLKHLRATHSCFIIKFKLTKFYFLNRFCCSQMDNFSPNFYFSTFLNHKGTTLIIDSIPIAKY